MNSLTYRPRLKKDLWSKFHLGPNWCQHKTGTIRNPRQKLQLIHDPLCFQNPPIRSIYRTNPQSVLFLRPNPSIRKPIHPSFYNSTETRRTCFLFRLKKHRDEKKENNLLTLIIKALLQCKFFLLGPSLSQQFVLDLCFYRVKKHDF